MSTYRKRKIKQALLSKGFHEIKTDHEMYRLWVKDKKTSVRTQLSFGSKEYGDNLLGCIARQMRLKRVELDEFIECPLGTSEYQKLLIERGHVKLPD